MIIGGWLDWEKLKREWRTVALAIVGIILESYDAVFMSGLVDIPALFPAAVAPFVAPAILVLMLLLRKWKDSHSEDGSV